MPKLAHVNTTDLKTAISLGCRMMQRVFNADDRDIPFFGSEVLPEAYLNFSSSHTESHVPGRHLNALLNAQDAAGVELDEQAIEKHALAAFFSYGGPAPLPLNRTAIDGPLVNFLPHNIREGFHALYALARFRDSQPARNMAEASIKTISRLFHLKHGWDVEKLHELGIQIRKDRGFIFGIARAIGPLVKYHRATGSGPALELAMLFKDKAMAEFFPEDGTFELEKFDPHVHSITCVMSSLAQLADHLGDEALLNRVRAFYDCGLWQMRDKLGWSIENLAPDRNPDLGEVNNTGDIVETALILGRWGHTGHYHDAERIIRGHMLPSQLRDNAFIADPPNPEGIDGKRNVADRLLGAFGLPAPYGHLPVGMERLGFATDIVGGTVGSLCEVFREVTRLDNDGHWVNLLFDHETEAIRVESPYTSDRLRVTLKRPGALFVRIPPWVERKDLTVKGTDADPRFTNGYLFLAQPPVGRAITIGFDLPRQDLVLNHRTHEIRVRLRGDEVVAMDNFGVDLTFFEPYNE